MAVDGSPLTTLTAFNRFGLGARPGDFAAAMSDPRGFLLQELRKPRVALITASLPSSQMAVAALFKRQERRRQERADKNGRMQLLSPRTMVTPPPPNPMPPNAMRSPLEMDGSDNYPDEVLARLQKQAQADVGFVERLVAFWSNHFTVSALKGQIVRETSGAFEREAIRPFVLGRFADMLQAVEQHPAMLIYLDNYASIGPNSIAGEKRGKGLNENLAREILELHTLGVDGGYSQADVTALACILTGWTYEGRGGGRDGDSGFFAFRPKWHEPGTPTLLGKSYPQDGMLKGEAALADLARHPATARHLARKLVRHFVADDPPPALVERLARVFRDTDGDLGSVSLALVQDDEAWQAPLGKMRSPDEFVAAINRASGVVPDRPGPSLSALTAMGMAPWYAAGPNGYPDIVAAWASPEAMKVRLDVAWRAAQRNKEVTSPNAVLDGTLGEAASAQTREAVSRAESREQGLAILFMSPEFQRR